MNNDKFNGLPDHLKKVVLDAVAAQNQYLRAYPKWKEFDAYEEFKKAGGKIYSPTAEEKESFKKAAMPVRENYLNSGGAEGKEWLTAFEQQVQACESKINSEDQAALK